MASIKEFTDKLRGIGSAHLGSADKNKAFSSREEALKEIYCELGRIYFEKHREGTAEADMAEYVEAARRLTEDSPQKESEGKRGEIPRENRSRSCPTCGIAVKKESLFCKQCGRALPAEPLEGENGVKFALNAEQRALSDDVPLVPKEQEVSCPKCKAIMPPQAAFCAECGTPLIKGGDEEPIKCPKCGDILPGVAEYCGKCGAHLKKEIHL